METSLRIKGALRWHERQGKRVISIITPGIIQSSHDYLKSHHRRSDLRSEKREAWFPVLLPVLSDVDAEWLPIQHRVHPQLCQLNQVHHAHCHLAVRAGLVVGVLIGGGRGGLQNRVDVGQGVFLVSGAIQMIMQRGDRGWF